MKKSYFKPRKPFGFSPHPYDIGNIFGFWKTYDDNHFLLKIYKIDIQCFANYYNYHLEYTLVNNIGNEEDFFSEVWRIVNRGIKHYEAQNPFSSSHSTHISSIQKLQQFQNFLKSVDKWNARPSSIIISEKDEVIQNQKLEIEKLQIRLTELEKYEVTQKIRIEENHLSVLADLIQQMRELELPSGRKLLKCDHKSPFYMMISKYFSDGGEDIPIETARNYFKGQGDYIKKTNNSNGAKEGFFKIVPANGIKK